MVDCKRPEPWGVPTGGFAGGLSHEGRNSIALIALCRWATKGVIMPREIVEPRKGKRYVRRGAKVRFKKEVDVGLALSRSAVKGQMILKKGEGDRLGPGFFSLLQAVA